MFVSQQGLRPRVVIGAFRPFEARVHAADAAALSVWVGHQHVVLDATARSDTAVLLCATLVQTRFRESNMTHECLGLR